MINTIWERNAPIVKLKVVSALTFKQTARTCLNVKACMHRGGTFINQLTNWQEQWWTHGVQKSVAWPRKSLQNKGEHAQLFFISAIAIRRLEGSTFEIGISQRFTGMLFRNCTYAIAISDVRYFKSVTWRLYFWDFKIFFLTAKF